MKQALLLLTLCVFGCTKGNFNNQSGAGRHDMAYALNNRVTTLDPGKVQDVDMEDVLQNVFEGLVAYDEHNQIAPKLASKWTLTNGGRTYLFTLRSDVKFQNGRPFVSDDFKWSIERNLTPSLNSPVAKNYLEPIEGVDDFVAGRAKSVTGIKVLGPHELSITLDKPRAYFLGDLTYPCAFVLAKEAAGSAEITKAEQAVGTGPFKFSRVEEDQELDLVANKDYHDGTPLVPKIVRPVILDPSTRLSKYRNGDLDELSVPRQDVEAVQKDPILGKQLQFQQRPAVYYFYLNEKLYPPFADARVRKAFAMALNRPHIVNDLLTGYTEAKGLLPPGMAGYRKNFAGLPYDPVQAKQLMTHAGFQDGSKMPPIELAYRESTPDARIACAAAASALEENLGVRVEPRAYEWATLLAKRNQGRLQMAFSSWYADYLDPQNFLSLLLTSTSPQNTEGWSNAQFDALCAKADIDTNQEERIKLYRQAEDIAITDGAKLPLYFQRDAVLINPRVQGIRTNLMGDLPHLKVRVVR